MGDNIACKNYDGNCEFNGTWFCKNPDCIKLPLTSTLLGARPSGCPLVDKWNSKLGAGGQNEQR